MSHEIIAAGLDPRRPLGNTRVTGKEQFYTPPETASLVVKHLLSMRPQARHARWFEPAGGTGNFIEAAISAGVEAVSSVDIEPRHVLVRQADFLAEPLDLSEAVAFGNPPFGRNNSLSVPFFNRAAALGADVICFIVPRSWRKWSVSNRLDTAFHLLSDTDLSINYVDAQGEDTFAKGNLRTCLQVWERRSSNRARIAVQDKGIIERCSVGEADVSLTIFGYSCGKVLTHFPRDRKITTQMYLRLGHPRALEALTHVDYAKFSDKVAYVRALALGEINYLLNEYLFGDPHIVRS